MAQTNISRWEVSKFSFNSEDQAAAWREFYTRALDYLETPDIDPETGDDNKKGWKKIKMMFTGKDRQALQTLIDNNTITPEDQCTPIHALKAIQTTIKEEEHYWHFRDKVMSDIRQQPDKQIHALNTRITKLVNNCRFQHQQTTETIKIMLLQHAIKYHEAHNWIGLQDPATITYQTLLHHCKLLKQRCEQFRKAQQKGRAELTTLRRATATQSSIHQDAITVNTTCHQCRHSHP